MTTMIRRCGITTAVLMFLAGPALADFKGLIARVPGDANGLVLIDVQKVLDSPLSAREGWKGKMAAGQPQKPKFLPPGTTRLVMAALIDPIDSGSIWEISLLDLAQPVSLDLMARAEGGYVDTLGQVPAVWSPINAYYIQLGPQMLGVIAPAERQFATRWAAKKSGSSSSTLSPYLASAAGTVSAEKPIVMAIDLQDITSAKKVRRRLETEKFNSLQDQKPDLDALSQTLGSIKGLTLQISVGEDATGKGAVDFGRDTAAVAGFAKPLMLEVLSQMGAYITDLDGWNIAAAGNQVTFEGKLTPDGLRRLLSLIQPPTPNQTDLSDAPDAVPSDKDVAAASMQYYASAKEIIQKLDKLVQGGRTPAPLTAIAIWFKRDSATISRLPIRNVDPDLVKFALDISVRLNDAARILSDGTLQTQARTVGIRSGYAETSTYVWDGVGRSNIAAQGRQATAQTVAQRQQITAEEKANAINQAAEIFKGVKAEAQKLRVEMTNRYKTEF